MSNSEIEAIIAARKDATAKLATKRTEFVQLKNGIILTAAQQGRPLTKAEIAAASGYRSIILEIDDAEEKLILVTNLELMTSQAVKSLAKRVEAANEELKNKAEEIKKIVKTVGTISDAIKKISGIVGALDKLATAFP